MPETLATAEICFYFESLPEGRRALVWVRCERLLGEPVEDVAPDDERLDEAFDQVLTDMWCSDQLQRLVELGRLRCATGTDGELTYSSPA